MHVVCCCLLLVSFLTFFSFSDCFFPNKANGKNEDFNHETITKSALDKSLAYYVSRYIETNVNYTTDMDPGPILEAFYTKGKLVKDIPLQFLYIFVTFSILFYLILQKAYMYITILLTFYDWCRCLFVSIMEAVELLYNGREV